MELADWEGIWALIKKPGNNHTITTVVRSSWRIAKVYSGEDQGRLPGGREDLELKSENV